MDKKNMIYTISQILRSAGESSKAIVPVLVDSAYKACVQKGFLPVEKEAPSAYSLPDKTQSEILRLFDSMTLASIQEITLDVLYSDEKENPLFQNNRLSISIVNFLYRLLSSKEEFKQKTIVDLCAGNGSFLASFLQKESISCKLIGYERVEILGFGILEDAAHHSRVLLD